MEKLKSFFKHLYKILLLCFKKIIDTVKKDYNKLSSIFKGSLNLIYNIDDRRWNRVTQLIQLSMIGILIFEVIYVNVCNIVGMDMVIMLVLFGVCLIVLILSLVFDIIRGRNRRDKDE